MKQLYQVPRTGEIALAEVPVPQVMRGCVLVRVAASVISAGTERLATEFAKKSLIAKAMARPDLLRHAINKARRDGILAAYEAAMHQVDQPQTLGYSCAGTVLAVGEDVDDIKVGDRVACGGGNHAVHAEVVCVPKNLTAKVPDDGDRNISLEEAAFATLGAVAIHGLRLTESRFGETVAVIGLGLIGLLTSQLVRASGGIAIGMDPNPVRCDLARRLGCAGVARNAEEFRRLCQARTNGIGADAVIIAAASEDNAPVVLAAEVARSRARIVSVGAVGLDLPRRVFFEKELSLRVSRSYGPGRYDESYEEKGIDYPIDYVRWTEHRNMESFLDFLSRGSLDVQALITHRFEISEAERAYDLIRESSDPSLGIIFRYSQEPQLARTVTLPCEVRPSTKRVKLGVIGAGTFGSRVLIPEFKRAGASLEGLCTARGVSGYYAGSKLGFRYCTTDLDELLRDQEINAIAIATQHHQHSSQLLIALAAGKHVFCEKPLCLTREDLQQIREFYGNMPEPRPLIMVGFNRRFAPMIREAKHFLSTATEPLMITYRVNAGFIPRNAWVQDPEIGGGRILGEICHFVDVVHFMTGSITKRVSARSLPNKGRYSSDNVIAILELNDGSIATITYSANGDRALGKERIEIFSEGRSVILDDFRRLELLKNGRQKIRRAFFRSDKGHRQQCAEFVAAVSDGAPSPISFEEMASCTATTLAIVQAVNTGTTIDLSEIDTRGRAFSQP
jgi:predicted dehydrogenase